MFEQNLHEFPHEFKDEAIVLKAIKLGESDRIVTFLTRKYGKIRAVAKGVRKTKSTIGGGVVEQLNRIELNVVLNKNPQKDLDIIKEPVIIEAFGDKIAKNYEKFVCANQMCELVDKLNPETRLPSEQHYFLLIRALKMLSDSAKKGVSANLISLSFTLRAFALAGWDFDDSILMNNANSDELLEFAENLMQGNWESVVEIAKNSENIESQFTKMLAKFATEILERKLNSF